MKSKLIIRVTDQFQPFNNNAFSGDWFGFFVDNGAGADPIHIHMTPTVNRTVKGLFIPKGSTVFGQVNNLIPKMRADWGNTGGYQNITFAYYESTDGNAYRQIEIELQNELWTFVTDGGGQAVAGGGVDRGMITQVSVTNNPAPVAKTLTLEATTTVDCANKYLQYTATITGGTTPYTIRGTALGNVTAATGTQSIQLRRGQDTNVIVTDATGQEIGRELITPPIFLEPTYFTVQVSQQELEAQAIVSPNVNLPSAVFPITYSLDNITYQSSGGFSGLQFEQVYTIYIRDSYGCVTSKQFITPPSIEGSETPEIYERYFEISNAGTLIFNKYSETEKRNFNNTLSCDENVGVPYSYIHEFDTSDFVVQQFKSSYDYHKITFLETNGTSFDIQPIIQSENLRQFEKVDAKIFRDVNGGLGIYFRGGNSYIENTETVNGISSYSATNLPSWAVSENKVRIDDIGTATIKRVSRDAVRGLYIVTNYPYSSLTDDDAKVQANYNKQPYNTYEFGFNISNITEGNVIIEAGFNDQNIGALVETTFLSERIKKITDDRDRYLISWSDPYNVAGIVHQTGITHFARVYMDFYNATKSESSTYGGDNETFNIDQKAYDVGIMEIAVKGFKMQQKLHLAAGMENFSINGINYKKTQMESEKQGDSNIYVVTGEFEIGGNNLNVNGSELVLNPPLTGLSGKSGIPNTIPNILNVGGDSLVLNGDGGFILVDNG